MSEFALTKKDYFEVGGENLFPSASNGSQPVGSDRNGSISPGSSADVLEDIRVRVGTLLKTENVSLLLGAGASVDCGGPLIGSVPTELERVLHNQGISRTRSPRLRRWLLILYLAMRYAGGGKDTPVKRQGILARRDALDNGTAKRLPVNFENVLATLHYWRSALSDSSDRLRIDGALQVNVRRADLDRCIRRATHALACACDLPTEEKKGEVATYNTLVRKLLTRPLNLKRVNIFTLNYDALVEQAADATGVVLLDGFVGTQNRVFRPESYEQDLYFPAETTEGQVHRFNRVLHLYKLHGSVTWTLDEPTLENPYGVRATTFDPNQNRPHLIYPTPAKHGEILGLPYSELFRRFAVTIVRSQSVLFVIGYGFGDRHVNAIIRQALAVPSFTLVIVDPSPTSQFVTTLSKLQDRRVWIATGPNLGKFSGFVHHLLPDLQDEEIRKRVMDTRRALTQSQTHESRASNG